METINKKMKKRVKRNFFRKYIKFSVDENNFKSGVIVIHKNAVNFLRNFFFLKKNSLKIFWKRIIEFIFKKYF